MVINLRKLRRRLGQLLLWLAALLLIWQAGAIVRWFYPIQYRETVYACAREYELDPLLVAAVIRVESKYRADAVSARGAVGLMQIMPETGAWIAEQLGRKDFRVDSLYDPVTNIRFGTWYLADLSREFGGDTALVLAAYNGGRGKVRQWLEAEQWSGGYHDIEQIPFQETREFIRRVYADHRIYQRLYPHQG